MTCSAAMPAKLTRPVHSWMRWLRSVGEEERLLCTALHYNIVSDPQHRS